MNFTVILQGPDYENRDALVAAANELVEANLAAGEVVVALGVSEYHPDEDHSFHEVFMRADRQMYERKQQLKCMGAKSRE